MDVPPGVILLSVHMPESLRNSRVVYTTPLSSQYLKSRIHLARRHIAVRTDGYRESCGSSVIGNHEHSVFLLTATPAIPRSI